MEAVSSRQTEGSVRPEERREEGQLNGRTVKIPTTLTHTVKTGRTYTHLETLTCGLLTGGSAIWVTVWNPKEKFKQIFEEIIHKDWITVMHAQSGDRLAVGFRDGIVKCLEWDQRTLRTNATLNPESTFAKPVCAIDTLPESGNLVVGHESGVSVWDTSGQQLYTKQWVSELENLKILPDGRIYLRFKGFTKIWDPVTGEELCPKKLQSEWMNYADSCIAINALSKYHFVEVFGSDRIEEVYLEQPPYKTYSLHRTGMYKMSAAETVAEEVLAICSSCDREVRIFEFKKFNGHFYQAVPHLISLKSEIHFFGSIYALKVLDDGRLAVTGGGKILIYS